MVVRKNIHNYLKSKNSKFYIITNKNVNLNYESILEIFSEAPVLLSRELQRTESFIGN